MCGILAALMMSGDAEKNRRDVLKRSKLLRHRGPVSPGALSVRAANWDSMAAGASAS